MTIDVVCAGAPFLDLVFRGLPRLPAAGEEVLATELVVVPGAMANVAFALRQLGVEAAVHAPIGTDPAGRLLQQLMADAGIPWLGSPAPATPVSVGLPMNGDRAFVTVHPTAPIDVAAIAAAAPRAVVVNLPLPAGMPAGPRLYGVVGDPQIEVLLDRPAESWASLRTVLLNEREAFRLSGRVDATEAAAELAGRGCVVVVTRGARGAAAALPGGRTAEIGALSVDILDSVGAGDLFAAAYVWSDLADRPLEDCLGLASAYAAHSLATAGTRQKGLTRTAFEVLMDSTREPARSIAEARG